MCTYTAVYVGKYKYLNLHHRLPCAVTDMHGIKAGGDREHTDLSPVRPIFSISYAVHVFDPIMM